MSAPTVDVVIPTIARASLRTLLVALAHGEGPWPAHVFVVDDRRDIEPAIAMGAVPNAFAERVVVLRSEGRGPAAARNVGWRASRADCRSPSLHQRLGSARDRRDFPLPQRAGPPLRPCLSR